jgi:hypothetical protein
MNDTTTAQPHGSYSDHFFKKAKEAADGFHRFDEILHIGRARNALPGE